MDWLSQPVHNTFVLLTVEIMKIRDIKDPELRALAEKRWDPKFMKKSLLKDDAYLSVAFDWHNTPEGEEFWHKVDEGEITSLVPRQLTIEQAEKEFNIKIIRE